MGEGFPHPLRIAFGSTPPRPFSQQPDDQRQLGCENKQSAQDISPISLEERFLFESRDAAGWQSDFADQHRFLRLLLWIWRALRQSRSDISNQACNN
jgi:hypothetical protein